MQGQKGRKKAASLQKQEQKVLKKHGFIGRASKEGGKEASPLNSVGPSWYIWSIMLQNVTMHSIFVFHLDTILKVIAEHEIVEQLEKSQQQWQHLRASF